MIQSYMRTKGIAALVFRFVLKGWASCRQGHGESVSYN